ncbi:MAG: branched-chain amino acid ABC transporter permease [Geminicoccales bacterium]
MNRFDAADALAALRRAARWRWEEILFWALAVLAFFVFPYRLPLLTEIVILALFALSLDLILGYAGIVSLGHAAFFGIGAYVAGLLAVAGWGEPISGLVLAVLAASALGFLTSFLVLRGGDLTRLMVTLGVALMLFEAANKADWLTGGADGLHGVVMRPILGLFEFDLFGRTAYVYSLVVLFILFYAARRLVASPFGLQLRGLRSNRLRMEAVGVPTNRRLVAIYTVGAGYAGAAGALLAQTAQFVSLDVLEFQRSAEVLLVLVIGGSGTLYGGPIGAIVFKVMHEWLAGITVQYWQFWLGLALVLLVLFARGGIMGLLAALRRRLGPERPGRASQDRVPVAER